MTRTVGQPSHDNARWTGVGQIAWRAGVWTPLMVPLSFAILFVMAFVCLAVPVWIGICIVHRLWFDALVGLVFWGIGLLAMGRWGLVWLGRPRTKKTRLP